MATIKEHLDAKRAEAAAPVVAPRLDVEIVCPSGKRGWPSKREAMDAMRGPNRKNAGQDYGRSAMRPYRCDFCQQYHLGHRR